MDIFSELLVLDKKTSWASTKLVFLKLNLTSGNGKSNMLLPEKLEKNKATFAKKFKQTVCILIRWLFEHIPCIKVTSKHMHLHS